MAKLDYSYYDYYKFTKFKLTEWDDIQEGVIYHIPPTIIYDRRDFICESKEDNRLRGQIREGDGNWSKVVLYRSELSVRFLVPIIPLDCKKAFKSED